MKSTRPIVLIGMMGSGKTSIGKLVAQELNFTFIDTDLEIEKKLNLSVKEIFENYGETLFRKKEFDVFKLFGNRNNIIISSGGGSFCNPSTYDLIKKNYLSVWLDVNEEILFNRLKRNQKKRPLLYGLKENELRNKVKNLISERKDCYNKADIKVELSDQKIKESFYVTYSKIISYISKN